MLENKPAYKTFTTQYFKTHFAQILRAMDNGEYDGAVETIKPEDIAKTIKLLTKDMKDAASDLEFETAAQIRDQIKKLEAMQLGSFYINILLI